MNRLTKRTTNCPLPVLVRDRAFGPAYFVSEEDYTDYRDALEKLARYEDTGLAPDELEKLVAFKEYFDALYGQGLQIANWHMNGVLEPFDSFYEEAIADNEEEDPDGKNDQMEP